MANSLLKKLILMRVRGQQYYYYEGSGSGSGDGSGSGTGETGTTEEVTETTTTTTSTTEKTVATTLATTTTRTETCCSPQQLGEIILLILQLLIIEGVIASPSQPVVTVSTEGPLPGVPGGAVLVPGGPLDNRKGSQGVQSTIQPTVQPTVPSILQATIPSVLLRGDEATLFLDPFSSGSTNQLWRDKSPFSNNFKINIVRQPRRGLYVITINPPKSSLWRGTSISSKLKFSLSSQNIKRLLTDKLKRTANFHDKLYKCKIFKKCKKTRYRCKNNKKCRNTKYIRKPLKETTTKANNLFRGSGILKLFN